MYHKTKEHLVKYVYYLMEHCSFISKFWSMSHGSYSTKLGVKRYETQEWITKGHKNVSQEQVTTSLILQQPK